MTQLKKIDCLNDVVAILRDIEAPEHLQVDKETLESLKSNSNEGVVVGVGPEVGDGVSPGDLVVFRNTKYMSLAPETGCYANKSIILARKIDLLVKKGRSEKYEIVDTLSEK